MALTLDTPIPEETGHFNTFPVAAAGLLFLGSALSLRANGYVGALVAGEPFVGHAYHKVDNQLGAAGAKSVNCWTGSYRARVALVAGLSDIGAPVYASDDATYTLDPASAAGQYTKVGHVHRRESATHCIVEFQTVQVTGRGGPGADLSKFTFFDDFFGLGLLLAESGSLGLWEDVAVGEGTVAIAADVHSGAAVLTLTATSEAQDAVLYFGDQLQFDIDQLDRMEFRAKVTTPGTGVRVVMGMAGDHNLAKDSVAQAAWFSLDAGLALTAEADDGTNEVDDSAIATITTAVWYDFAIDFRNKADIKFYVNGVQVATGATFSMAAYTGGLQPYFSADKASGTGLTVVTVDYVRVTGRRA